MKNLILSIALITLSGSTIAQSVAIANDKDGFVNVRKGRDPKSPIIGKIVNDDVFTYDEEDKSTWIKILQQNSENPNGNPLEGYLHKSRLIPLSKLNRIKETKFYKDSCIAVNDSLKITIKSNRFNPNAHKLSYSRPGEKNTQKFLLKIDGKHFLGTDGNIPKKFISSLSVFKNGIKINIPETVFNDLYEPSLKTIKVYIKNDNIIYIQLDNSDGAGSYTVIWTIKNNRYFKRYVDNSNA
jgi:hypothetical protein